VLARCFDTAAFQAPFRPDRVDRPGGGASAAPWFDVEPGTALRIRPLSRVLLHPAPIREI
jgi:hypothetical protein